MDCRWPTKASCISSAPPGRSTRNTPPTCSALGPEKAPFIVPVTGSEGGVNWSSYDGVIGGSRQRDIEASIVAEWRASADMDAEERVAGREVSGIVAIILVDSRGDRAMAEIGG